jgi:hypothetical protein
VEWRELHNLHRGSAFGLSHPIHQLGPFRPYNRHSSLKNLYFVGASTHPGTGVPLVFIGARMVVQRILEDLGMKLPEAEGTEAHKIAETHRTSGIASSLALAFLLAFIAWVVSLK